MALTIKQREKIKKLLDAGHTSSQIAEVVKCSKGAVDYFRRQQRQKGADLEQLAAKAIAASPAVSVAPGLKVESWEALIPQALTGGLDFLAKALPHAEAHDPRSIAAVAAAVASLMDMELSLKVIRARMDGARLLE